MTVRIRPSVTFARAVYLDHNGARGKTTWWARQHMLDDEIASIRFGFPRWTLLYIERCRLKPDQPKMLPAPARYTPKQGEETQ